IPALRLPRAENKCRKRSYADYRLGQFTELTHVRIRTLVLLRLALQRGPQHEDDLAPDTLGKLTPRPDLPLARIGVGVVGRRLQLVGRAGRELVVVGEAGVDEHLAEGVAERAAHAAQHVDLGAAALVDDAVDHRGVDVGLAGELALTALGKVVTPACQLLAQPDAQLTWCFAHG